MYFRTQGDEYMDTFLNLEVRQHPIRPESLRYGGLDSIAETMQQDVRFKNMHRSSIIAGRSADGCIMKKILFYFLRREMDMDGQCRLRFPIFQRDAAV